MMIDIDSTVDCFLKLQVNGLDEDWVKQVWARELVDFPDVDDDTKVELQEKGWMAEVMLEMLHVLQPWIKGEHTDDNTGFWTVLVEHDINYRAVVALLAYIIVKGQRPTAGAGQKRSSLLALRVYTSLVVIPGSAAFRLFHPMLFSRCVDGLNMWITLGAVGKRKKKSPKQRGKSKKANAKKRTKDGTADLDDTEDEADDGETEITPGDMKMLHKHIIQLFQDVFTLLKRQSLSASPESTDSLLDTLTELCRLSPETFRSDFTDDEDFVDPRHPHIAALSFKAMLLLINEIHGDVPTMITHIFKRLLCPVLMMYSDKTIVSSQTIPQSIILIKQHCLNFICHVLAKFGLHALTSTRTLIQHMCIKVPDKTDYRNRAAEAICTLLERLPDRHCISIVRWIQKLSQSAKTNYRGFAIDVVANLLLEKERPFTVELTAADCRVMSHLYLLEIILERCSDITPTVRSRAIGALASCVSDPDAGIMTKLQTMFTPVVATKQSKIQRLIEAAPGKDGGTGDTAVATPTDTIATDDRRRTPAATQNMRAGTTPVVPVATPVVDGLTPTGVLVTPGTNLDLTDCEGVVSMLRRRCVDKTVGVRKSAVQAIQAVVCLEGDTINKVNLECLTSRCRDAALSVRKQAMVSLTEILHLFPDNQLIQWYWMDGVLPLVMDRESTIQDKCLEFVEEILLANITVYHRSNTPRHQMAWSMVEVLASSRGQELRFHLKQAFMLMAQRKVLKSQLVPNLITHVGKEDHDSGAWMLLAECTTCTTKLDAKIVIDYWKYEAKFANSVEKYATYERVLSVVGHLADHLPHNDVQILIDDLKSRLSEFKSPPELIAVTVNTLFKLHSANEPKKGEGRKLMTSWSTNLLKLSDTYLSSVILNQNHDSAIDEDRIICHLFTVGHVGHLCPNAAPKHILMLVQSLIAGPGVYQPKGQDTYNSLCSQAETQTEPTAESQNSQTESQRPDSQMSIAGTQVLTQFSGSKLSTRIRAHAFIALGKLCLQNETVAKRCVAAMVRELDCSEDPVIRNNVMIILCDLCVRYTTLTDRYISQIANCIRDQSPLVRKQTLTCIMSLLQEDYMKWRGTLLYKFLIALVDENETISQFAEFCFVHLLLNRQPGLFFQHFVEAIFYFNSYDDHPVYNKFNMNDKEKTNFSLKGPENKVKRFRLYKFMLENMTDAQRFNMMAKLSQDILGGFTDQQMSLGADSQPILNDTLEILCSKEIKVSTLRGRGDDADDDLDPTAAAVNVAKKNLVTQVVKKNVMENIIPMIIALKHMLEADRSPLLRDLMMFLRDLMRGYKNEIKDLLAADKQLASEIEFDLRRFEEEQQREQNPPQPIQPPVLRIAPGTPLRSPRVGAPRPPTMPPPASPVPRNLGTPSCRTPRPISGSPRSPAVLRTPPRNKHLDIANLVNSAKKAMQSAGMSPAPNKGTRQSPMSRKADIQKHEDAMLADNDNDDITPEGLRRAISTPDRTIVDITFRGEMSMIAPSPISPQTTRVTRRANKTGGRGRFGRPLTAIRETNVILLASPQQPAPKPRHWNVNVQPLPPLSEGEDDVLHGEDGAKRMEVAAVGKHVSDVGAGHVPSDENDPRAANVQPEENDPSKTLSKRKEDVSESVNVSTVRRSGRVRKT